MVQKNSLWASPSGDFQHGRCRDNAGAVPRATTDQAREGPSVAAGRCWGVTDAVAVCGMRIALAAWLLKGAKVSRQGIAAAAACATREAPGEGAGRAAWEGIRSRSSRASGKSNPASEVYRQPKRKLSAVAMPGGRQKTWKASPHSTQKTSALSWPTPREPQRMQMSRKALATAPAAAAVILGVGGVKVGVVGVQLDPQIRAGEVYGARRPCAGARRFLL